MKEPEARTDPAQAHKPMHDPMCEPMPEPLHDSMHDSMREPLHDPSGEPGARAKRRFFSRPYRWAICYALFLTAAVLLVLLDAFVIPRAVQPAALTGLTASSAAAASIAGSTAANAPGASAAGEPVMTDTRYEDASIRIHIDTIRQHETDIYIADVQLKQLSCLRTAFARETFGRNFREPTSAMATAHKAILAINGDYYGVRDHGFVLRNGTLYRSEARLSGLDDALVIDRQGTFSIVSERQANAAQLAAAGAWQIFTFGPALVTGGAVAPGARSEVAQSMPSNPRAAIGQVAPLHYVFIVSDGRTRASAGLSLLQLAQLFTERGCTVAYNLDGGGSATLWFGGRVINRPTDGRSQTERSVSDIVYIGYP